MTSEERSDKLLALVERIAVALEKQVGVVKSIAPPNIPTTKVLAVPPKCPDCGGQMLLKTNRQNGNQFFGCMKYPSCKGTLNSDGSPSRVRKSSTMFGDDFPDDPQDGPF